MPTITLWRRYGFAFVAPLIWGGLAYSLGGLLELSGLVVSLVALGGLVAALFVSRGNDRLMRGRRRE